MLMIFAPWVVWLLFGGWAVVQLVRKRPALWIVITGIVLSVVIYVLANVLLSMSI